MPNSRQSSASGSPGNLRVTDFISSSIPEHSFQGIAPSPLRGESVPYVSGTMCYLCLRPLIFALREYQVEGLSICGIDIYGVYRTVRNNYFEQLGLFFGSLLKI